MAKRHDKEEKDEKERKDEKSNIEQTNTWINRTRSGKGFIIYVKDSFEEDDVLLGSIEALQEFIDKERTGINLGKLILDDERD